MNPENGNHYAVIAAKPLYQYGSDQVDNMAWMHATPYYAHAVEDTEDMEESLSKGTLFNMDDINEYSGAFRYADISCDNYNVTTHDDGTESYIPYTTTVYNLEVEDYHTYCIGGTYQISWFTIPTAVLTTPKIFYLNILRPNVCLAIVMLTYRIWTDASDGA